MRGAKFRTMSVEIVTKQDLIEFKGELLRELKSILMERSGGQASKWLRSAQVRKLLNISAGTLQQMRITGDLKYTKVGGIHFYLHSDIESMLTKNQS